MGKRERAILTGATTLADGASSDMQKGGVRFIAARRVNSWAFAAGDPMPARQSTGDRELRLCYYNHFPRRAP